MSHKLTKIAHREGQRSGLAGQANGEVGRRTSDGLTLGAHA